METEEEFKNTVSVLRDLEKQKEALSDESIEKAHNEANKCIETQFERCFIVLAARKQLLLAQVEATTNEHKKQKEIHEKQTLAAIEGCKKLLETSTALYSHHRSAALSILKSASELKQDVNISPGITVSFDMEVIHKLESYGSVYTPEKNISTIPPAATKSEPAPLTENKKERVVTFAGSCVGLEDGIGENTKFSGPRGMCLDTEDKSLYVCDSYNNVIRKLTMKGEVSTFAAKKGDLQLSNPYGIVLHQKEGCFYVTSMLHHSVKKVTLRGVISIIAGTGKPGNKDNKEGSKASFHCPAGITVDQSTGNLYVSDQNNHCIRIVTTQGVVSTLAGAGQTGFRDGQGSGVLFNFPTGIHFVEKMQCLVVCDTANNRLRKISLAGAVSTIYQVAEPTDVTMANGKLYVTTYSNVIVILVQNESGVWTKEGESIASGFEGPHGIVVDEASQSCFVADCDNNRICKISL